MIQLRINSDKVSRIYTEFSEVNLKHIKAAYEMMSFLKKDELEDFKAFKAMKPEFMIDWVLIFSDLDREVLENINITSETDLSLTQLFDFCRHFGGYPEKYKELKEFKHHGKTYKVIPPLTTISGTQLLFGNASYKQHKLMAQLSSAVDGSTKNKVVESLQQLLAVLYTDGDDTDEGIKKRIEAFKDLDGFTAWSGWFFFVQLTHKYKSFFQSFSSQEGERKGRIKIAVENLRTAISNTFFGKLLKMKWLKAEYSILED